MSSMSDSSIASSKRDEPDGGIKRSHSEERVGKQIMEFSDDDEMEYYENVNVVKAKPAKAAKQPKGRPSTRKSARNTVKTDFSDYSD